VYRLYVNQADVDPWLLWARMAMFAFALAYAHTVPRRWPREPTATDLRWPSWKPFLLLTAPVWIFAVGAAVVTGQQASYWAGGLVTQFLLLLIPLTVFLYLRETPARRVLPTLILTALAMALVGSRGWIVAPLVMIAWALAATGRPIGTRKMVLLIGVLALLGSCCQRHGSSPVETSSLARFRSESPRWVRLSARFNQTRSGRRYRRTTSTGSTEMLGQRSSWLDRQLMGPSRSRG
jgi:hypothetical protein